MYIYVWTHGCIYVTIVKLFVHINMRERFTRYSSGKEKHISERKSKNQTRRILNQGHLKLNRKIFLFCMYITFWINFRHISNIIGLRKNLSFGYWNYVYSFIQYMHYAYNIYQVKTYSEWLRYGLFSWNQAGIVNPYERKIQYNYKVVNKKEKEIKKERE